MTCYGRLFSIGLQERHNSTFRQCTLSEIRSAYQLIQACVLHRLETKDPTRKDMRCGRVPDAQNGFDDPNGPQALGAVNRNAPGFVSIALCRRGDTELLL